MRTQKEAITTGIAIIKMLQAIYEITDIRNEFSIYEKLEDSCVTISIKIDFN